MAHRIPRSFRMSWRALALDSDDETKRPRSARTSLTRATNLPASLTSMLREYRLQSTTSRPSTAPGIGPSQRRQSLGRPGIEGPQMLADRDLHRTGHHRTQDVSHSVLVVVGLGGHRRTVPSCGSFLSERTRLLTSRGPASGGRRPPRLRRTSVPPRSPSRQAQTSPRHGLEPQGPSVQATAEGTACLPQAAITRQARDDLVNGLGVPSPPNRGAS